MLRRRRGHSDMRARYAAAGAAGFAFAALTWVLLAQRDLLEPPLRPVIALMISGRGGYDPDDYAFAIGLAGLMSVTSFASLAYVLVGHRSTERRIDDHLRRKPPPTPQVSTLSTAPAPPPPLRGPPPP
ncbi:MAG: hypothetical protein EPO51_23995 [Phenylobacterium sp.]|uniref:hypothetical protein n=1 Tax=Phenylobacterium sp. TaxID=1871053 RepID=UPI0012229040|nr:hypothetical protein [Phenylobacterium sp.]TAJ69103.1 MAG: hypothetical protein EPO51_23995 [Phenylobacterium sp.]